MREWLEQVGYFRGHPPECLAGFRSRSIELPGFVFGGHGSGLSVEDYEKCRKLFHAPKLVNPIFALSCGCGAETFRIHGYLGANPDLGGDVMLLGPLVLGCTSCRTMTDLMDTAAYGFDARMGHGSPYPCSEGDRAVYACPDCGEEALEVFARFEFPDYLFDGSLPKFIGREEELFSWFTVVARCQRCSQLLNVADFECA